MSAEVGLSVTHRRYVKYGDAHYAGNLVDGAYVLGLFGDVATEVCIRGDADEGLFASYSDVQSRSSSSPRPEPWWCRHPLADPFSAGAHRATIEVLRRWWRACRGSNTRPW